MNIEGEELRLVRLDLKDHPGHPRLMYYLGVLLGIAQGMFSLVPRHATLKYANLKQQTLWLDQI